MGEFSFNVFFIVTSSEDLKVRFPLVQHKGIVVIIIIVVKVIKSKTGNNEEHLDDI